VRVVEKITARAEENYSIRSINLMNRLFKLMAIAGLALTLSLPLTAVAQERTADTIYAEWYPLRTTDPAKALELAKEYVAKFPNGQQIKYMKGYISGERAKQLNKAITTDKNITEAIRIANEEFAENPENVDYLYYIVYGIRSVELEANPPNYGHANEVLDYGQRAIKAIEAGKPATVYKPEQRNGILAYIAQTLANVEAKNNNIDKAIEWYKKSNSYIASSSAKGDVSTVTYNYYRMGFLYQMKYEAASKKYTAFPDADKTDPPTKPEVFEALNDLNTQTDALVDAWAHFLASPESQSYKNRAEIESTVTELYKFRHKGSTDGLQKLIDGYKPGAAPSN
jgi:hypothetical protein